MPAYIARWMFSDGRGSSHDLLVECAPEFAAQSAHRAVAALAARIAPGRVWHMVDVRRAPAVGDPVEVTAVRPTGGQVPVRGTLVHIGDPEPSAAGGTYRQVTVRVGEQLPAGLGPYWTPGLSATMAQAQAWPVPADTRESVAQWIGDTVTGGAVTHVHVPGMECTPAEEEARTVSGYDYTAPVYAAARAALAERGLTDADVDYWTVPEVALHGVRWMWLHLRGEGGRIVVTWLD